MKKLGLLAVILAALANICFGQTPTTADGWYNQGIKEYQANNLQAALVSTSECIRLNPKAHKCYYNRGVIYSERNELDLAILEFQKAIEVAPSGYSGNYNNLAGILYRQKKYNAAITFATSGIAFFPNDELLYRNRGLAYYAIGKYDEAISDSTKSILLKKEGVVYS